MKKIRNKNTGAEYSSPNLIRRQLSFKDTVDSSLPFFTFVDWEEVKEDNSSIGEAAYDYSCSFSEKVCKECNNICGVTGDCPISECREKTFKAGAIWMRDSYLKEYGWHDLEKNPDDLPKDGQRVIVKIGRSVCGLEYNENFAIYNDCNRKFWEIPPTGTWAIDTVNSDNNVVIAWMELPEFKRE